jgi:hypothetical protein
VFEVRAVARRNGERNVVRLVYQAGPGKGHSKHFGGCFDAIELLDAYTNENVIAIDDVSERTRSEVPAENR